jgi:hypothetical protein
MLGAVCGAVADCPAALCGGPAGSPAPLSAFRSWSVWDVLHRLHHPPAGQGIRRAAPRAAVGGLATGSSRRRGVRRWLVPRPRCRLVPLVAFLPAGWSFCLIPPAAQPPSCSAVLKPAVRVLCGLEPVVWLSRGFRSGLCGRGRWGDEAGDRVGLGVGGVVGLWSIGRCACQVLSCAATLGPSGCVHRPGGVPAAAVGGAGDQYRSLSGSGTAAAGRAVSAGALGHVWRAGVRRVGTGERKPHLPPAGGLDCEG